MTKGLDAFASTAGGMSTLEEPGTRQTRDALETRPTELDYAPSAHIQVILYLFVIM